MPNLYTRSLPILHLLNRKIILLILLVTLGGGVATFAYVSNNQNNGQKSDSELTSNKSGSSASKNNPTNPSPTTVTNNPEEKNTKTQNSVTAAKQPTSTTANSATGQNTPPSNAGTGTPPVNGGPSGGSSGTQPVACPSYPTIPAGPNPSWGCWPSPLTVGLPSNITLTPYTGDMAVQTDGLVIDSKLIDGELRILAKNVVIKNSKIRGTVRSDISYLPGTFTITDSTIEIGDWPGTGIQESHFVMKRVVVQGGSRGIFCNKDCLVEDSYIVGGYADQTGVHHMSGGRMSTDGIFRRNVIGCSAPDIPPDAGCSAGITGYGDFETVQNNLFENNLILPGGGYCSYGGSSNKPFPNANNIRYISNWYVRGESGQCGFWGAITSFDSNAPGNIWQNNRYYPDGAAVAPAN